MKPPIALALSCAALMTPVTAFAQGSSGHGGGLALPHVPVNTQQIESAALDSKTLILEWLFKGEGFHALINANGNPQTPESERLFGAGVEDTFRILSTLKIEIRSDGPCYDGKEEVDASIFSKVPGAICLSTKRLAAKLFEFDYQAETAALIVHELVHLVHGTEAEARQAQTRAVSDLIGYTALDEKIRLDVRLSSQLEDVIFEIEATDLRYAQLAGSCASANGLVKQMITLMESLPDDRYHLYPFRARWDYGLRGQIGKMRALEDYLCGADPTQDPEVRRHEVERYSKGFGEATEVTSRGYDHNIDGLPELATLMPVSFRKVSSLKEVVGQLRELATFFRERSVEIKALSKLKFELAR